MNTPAINSNAYKKQGLSIVVFGASGHLARVKIMPSLFRLFGHYDKLPPFTFIYGYARTKMTSEEWRESLKRDLMSTSGANSDLVTEFLSKCVYVSGDSYRDVAAYSRLVELIKEQEDQRSLMHQQLNRMFYLAVPPNVFIDAAMVRSACMRVVVESRRVAL
jgi:glucose-6-phosphate 1-dehydrogenase